MFKNLKKVLKVIGPGFITGASDDDPSGIGTYSQTGAQFGYSQLWTMFFAFPFMIVVQEMCGRIGMVTGKGIAVIVRDHYAKWILYISVFLLLVANTINIGADLGAMASSGQLVFHIPFIFWLIVMTVITILLEIFVPYPAYAKILKYLTFSLFAYFAVAFIVHQDWTKILVATVIPSFSFSKDYIMNIVALLGTTISPYLFFWQADEEVEEEVQNKRLKAMGVGIPRLFKKDIREMRLDTFAGMFFSQIVTFFIIVSTASTLHVHGIFNIVTADQAAEALRPFAGEWAFLLFALGVVGTGFLAVPVLAGSAAYAIAETFHWKEGLARKLKQAYGFYGVIAFATLAGLLVNFTPIKPFQMLYYTAIVNGVVAPPLMILIMFIGNNKTIMGEHTNSKFSNIFGWIITVAMGLSALALLWSFVK